MAITVYANDLEAIPTDSPTHGSDGTDSLTLPVPSTHGHTWTNPPGEELIAGQG